MYKDEKRSRLEFSTYLSSISLQATFVLLHDVGTLRFMDFICMVNFF